MYGHNLDHASTIIATYSSSHIDLISFRRTRTELLWRTIISETEIADFALQVLVQEHVASAMRGSIIHFEPVTISKHELATSTSLFKLLKITAIIITCKLMKCIRIIMTSDRNGRIIR